MKDISDLFNHFMSLIGLNYYNKSEVDTLMDCKVSTSDSRLTDSRTPKSHTHGNISNTGTLTGKSQNVVTDSNGAITTEAKPTIPTKVSELTNDSGFLTEHQNLTNYLQKSSTSGLVKNDGTIDTTSYVNTTDSRLSDARSPTSHTHTKSEISDFPSTMTPSAHTSSSSSTYGAASTSVYGHVKLSTSTSSTSTSLAATPSAVRSAYNLANEKLGTATYSNGQLTIS